MGGARWGLARDRIDPDQGSLGLLLDRQSAHVHQIDHGLHSCDQGKDRRFLFRRLGLFHPYLLDQAHS